MPRKKKDELDSDEHLVLKELKSNSNKSINEIAKNCGFSRQKVWRIIKKFEKNKTIWGYPGVVNEEKEDLNYYILLLKRNSVPIPQSAIKHIVSREVDDHINKIDCNMITSLYTSGYYDWVIIFTAPNLKMAKRVSELFRTKYHGILKDVILMETIFPVKIQGIINPNVENLKKFF